MAGSTQMYNNVGLYSQGKTMDQDFAKVMDVCLKPIIIISQVFEASAPRNVRLPRPCQCQSIDQWLAKVEKCSGVSYNKRTKQ